MRLLGIGYLILVIGLFLYSFTQVDLSLTLSRWSVWQVIQKYFQHIGYFQRSLSTVLYIVIVLLLCIFYLVFLILAHKNNITKKQVWILIIVTTFILAFSYNAFSYDLFNYIFDAKIFTFYHQNPYVHKALDFPKDPMLSFMHWTHRIYPYGPTWLLLTVPLSFLGFQVFLPTFFLFKFIIAYSFLGTVFFIGKIIKKVYPQNETFGIVFFALNPLVIIESLVSSHNDTIMIFLLIFSLYLLMDKKYTRSFILFMLSIGVKFATVFLAPILALIYFFQKRKQDIDWQMVFILICFLMTIPIVLASIRTNFQPWYLLYVLPFAALVSKKYYVFIPSTVISFFSLLQYAPFLYLGNWDKPVPTILFWLTASSVILSILFTAVWRYVGLSKKQNKMIKW